LLDGQQRHVFPATFETIQKQPSWVLAPIKETMRDFWATRQIDTLLHDYNVNCAPKRAWAWKIFCRAANGMTDFYIFYIELQPRQGGRSVLNDGLLSQVADLKEVAIAGCRVASCKPCRRSIR
jgi:hypothetical protein